MTAMSNWSLRFIRWGMGLGIAGLIAGYIPLGHYLMKDSLPSCPAAPVHGHTILLSLIGMTLFGLVYRALPQWMTDKEPPLALIRLHFWLAVIGTIGVCVNGTIGYEIVNIFFQHGFYYNGPRGQDLRNVWFGLDGVFLTIYALGCAILLYILLTKANYSRDES